MNEPVFPVAAVPFPVADTRFDQKNEMFKRSMWDPAVKSLGDRFYREVVYRDRPGYRKVDYALRNASWNLEWEHAQGNAHADFGLYAWEGIPAKARLYVETDGPVTGSPDEMSRFVKRAARFYGAGRAGVCDVHSSWVYSHQFDLTTGEHMPTELPEDCRQAVVLAVPMDEPAMRGAPTGIGGAGTGLGYSHMAVVANLVAAFIRGLGYRALPCGNDTALSVPMAMAAGLGEWSRMGLWSHRSSGRACGCARSSPTCLLPPTPTSPSAWRRSVACARSAPNTVPRGPSRTGSRSRRDSASPITPGCASGTWMPKLLRVLGQEPAGLRGLHPRVPVQQAAGRAARRRPRRRRAGALPRPVARARRRPVRLRPACVRRRVLAVVG